MRAFRVETLECLGLGGFRGLGFRSAKPGGSALSREPSTPGMRRPLLSSRIQSECKYIYIYIHIYIYIICVCVYIYIYIYLFVCLFRDACCSKVKMPTLCKVQRQHICRFRLQVGNASDECLEETLVDLVILVQNVTDPLKKS